MFNTVRIVARAAPVEQARVLWLPVTDKNILLIALQAFHRSWRSFATKHFHLTTISAARFISSKSRN
jgi:hypothetical protein